MSMTKTSPDIAVIGGGAAGLMAAYTAASLGARVTLFEKNRRTGRKLRITGKGRCNLTNDCEPEEFLRNVPTNPRFLFSSIYGFKPSDTQELFESCLGVPLKSERGKRVFPVSDNANDIADALTEACKSAGVRIITAEKVTSLSVGNGSVTGIVTKEGMLPFSAVIVATGGISYPLTGSDGDGYRFAKSAGHTVTPLRPSLVPLTASGICRECQGLSLKNVGFSVEDSSGKKVYEDFGELMFTHFGLTGPVVLSASAHISDITPGKYCAVIDLKPALDEKKLDLRIQSDFHKYINRDFQNSLGDLLPQKLVTPFVKLTEILPTKKVNAITREEREKIVAMLKHLSIPLNGFRPIDEAIVTKGGVSVKELDPHTMGSKLVKGLYFAGEVIDVDAYTGGFNLQIAFSTGVAAGRAAAEVE